MNPNYYQTVPRKKDKTDALLCHPFLADFVLDCRHLSTNALESMLQKYDMVVFKPNIGGGGKNVGFMSQSANKRIHIQHKTDKYIFSDINEVYDFIKNLNKKKRFILQEGVKLLTYENKPIDVRVEMQKVYDEWEMSGIVAKVAAEDKMVTNCHVGGRGVLLSEIFQNIGISDSKYQEVNALLITIGFMSARLLNKKYDGLRELGFDIGIDQNFHLYILEINTKPRFGVFKQANDPVMYQRIFENNEIIHGSIDHIKREL